MRRNKRRVDLTYFALANAGLHQLGQEGRKAKVVGTRHGRAVINAEVSHVSDQEGQVIPQRAFDCWRDIDAV